MFNKKQLNNRVALAPEKQQGERNDKNKEIHY